MDAQKSMEMYQANAGIIQDTVMVIPSKRPAPIKTLENFSIAHHVMVISDPDVFDQHREWIAGLNNPFISNTMGRKGMVPQELLCCTLAKERGFEFYFKMDDDLQPRTFIGMEKGWFPSPEEAMFHTRMCAEQMGTDLNGFVNSSIRVWMSDGYNRSYGLVHGGSHLCRVTDEPERFVKPDLPSYIDVYKSAAYRMKDGAIGRVNFIGLEKRISQRDSVMGRTPEKIELAKKMILEEFGNIVTCTGTRTLDDGRQTIPNWRLKRGDRFIDKYEYRAQRRKQ
jgi:hypothetical protein